MRAYTAKPVEKDKLELILEAGRVAPTGANRQPQRLIVVQGEEGLNKVAMAANIRNAPVAIIICSDVDEVWERPFDGKKLTDIDASIVTDHMMLAATELELGSLWICHFKPEIIRSEFELPLNLEPVNILLLGYADTEKEPERSAARHSTERKALAETVWFEKI